nr:DUF1593 domain-containing protein [Asticcacaulis excentricus]
MVLVSARSLRASIQMALYPLTDIEADPDDSQSIVRLLLYANQIDIEGLVATTSVHQKALVSPASIHAILNAYSKVQPNLLKHEPGFPKAAALHALVSEGLPVYGMTGVGSGKDSAGSEWIIRALEKEDKRPLWVAVWGGANTLAQALYKIKATHTPEEVKRLISRLRVYTISDQDDTGIWIRKTFPDLFYIVSPGGYGNATWGGINTVEPGFDNSEISNAWIAENIQQGHGPLGAAYPDVGYGVEGDTPTFLSLISNGLNAPERPDWGGWGGRYTLYTPEFSAIDPTGFTGGVPVETEPRPIWTNATDSVAPYSANDYGRNVKASEKLARGFRTTIWRWRKDFQIDFAARMDWTTKSYSEANHPPVPALGHSDRLTVKSGTGFSLSAAGTTDPDGDSLSYLWMNYPEAGTLKHPIPIGSAENLYRVNINAPVVNSPETAHFILKVTDKGTPALTRYKRVVVTIVP